jgi:hypothetical protein
MATDLDAELDRLYGLPLGEFTAARNELAKQLRGEGNREEAEHVKALRKPSVAAWLVNRIARERELDVQRLLKASETLRSAQAEAAAGHTEAFADARRDEHQALERLAEAAQEIAAREGSGQAAVAQATQTLRAAALTDEGRELLKRGRLSEELEPPGFEALTGLVPAQPRKGKRKRGEEPQQAVRKAREQVKRLREQEREADAAARAAEREAERAEQEAAKLREQATQARAQAETATVERVAAEEDAQSLAKPRR